MTLIDDEYADEGLPHRLEAERAVLGAVLLRADALAEVRDIVTPEDFYRTGHATLFRRMLGLADAGKAIDLVTLMTVLDRHGEVETVGGPAYITRLVDGVPRSINAVHYAEEVRGCALRRELIRVAEQLRIEARTADDVEEARTAAEQALRGMQAGVGTSFTSAEAAVASAFETLDAFDQAEHVGVTGVPTSIAGLDDLIGGWQRAELNVIAAQSSHGKTAFVAQCAGYASVIRRVPTLFATNEQLPGSLALRLASNRARVNLKAIRKKFAHDDELERFGDALHEINRAPLTFYWARGKRMSDIRRHARLLHAKGQCEMLVIDYLGLVTPEASTSRNGTREREVAQQAEMARDVASELNIPVLLCVQMNGNIERDAPRGKKPTQPRRPRLTDLRESVAVGHHADVLLFVHRPFARPNNPEEAMRQGQTDLIVAKVRNGEIGDVSAHFNGAWQRFEETT